MAEVQTREPPTLGFSMLGRSTLACATLACATLEWSTLEESPTLESPTPGAPTQVMQMLALLTEDPGVRTSSSFPPAGASPCLPTSARCCSPRSGGDADADSTYPSTR